MEIVQEEMIAMAVYLMELTAAANCVKEENI